MFGVSNRVSASFSGSVFNHNGHMADIELDGTGKTSGQRKFWRFRLLNGQVEQIGEYEMRMNDRSRQVRFASNHDDSDYGYVELL